MPTARTKTNLQRTLLILLGIILAGILTLNAKTLYSSESIVTPKSNTIENGLSLPSPSKGTGMIFLQDLTKKFIIFK